MRMQELAQILDLEELTPATAVEVTDEAGGDGTSGDPGITEGGGSAEGPGGAGTSVGPGGAGAGVGIGAGGGGAEGPGGAGASVGIGPGGGLGGGGDVTRAYASDLLSDVLANAPEGGILLTLQVHLNVIAVASHAGLQAVIFTCGRHPDDDVIERAAGEGLALYASRACTFELSGRLYELGLRGSPA